jgi:hypothetical protein
MQEGQSKERQFLFQENATAGTVRMIAGFGKNLVLPV